MADEFILGVDLDGVCGDYNHAFRNAVARHRGVIPDSLTLDVQWDFVDWDLDREGFLAHHRRAVVEDRIFATMPPIPGAAEALWRLSDAGVWIRLITHRLIHNWSHATVVSDTVEWLDNTGIPYRDICFLGQKPQVEADAYIDDAPHNVEALRAAGNEVIVFNQSYNRELAGPRADNWMQAEEIITRLVLDHSGSYPASLPGLDPDPDRIQRNRPRT